MNDFKLILIVYSPWHDIGVLKKIVAITRIFGRISKKIFLPYIELKKILLPTYIIMPQDYKSSEPMDNLVQEIRENLQLESAVGSNTVTTVDQHRDLQLKNHSR